MATFYTDSNERVAAPMLYLREHLPSSYHEAPVLPGNMMLYMNSTSYSDTLAMGSASQQQQQEDILSNFNWPRIREQDFNALHNFNSLGNGSSSILQNGLSLSLGTQIPGGGFRMDSTPYQNASMGLVEKRYKQYYHQIQFVVSSFDAIAGPGSAKPYTALALQRISRHFRCLKDAINDQISATRKGLGEQDSSPGNNGIGIARLRYVDQQLRQQKALQQLGMMQQHAAWRPQRGLPQSSVSILRAWLFEHFLHPYPKDSDKIILSRQTGLSRSQVSNWFINARVRLWKPMVEEMYKEEIGDPEMDSNSSSENTAKAKKVDTMGVSEERGEDSLQKATSPAASERCNPEKFCDLKPIHIPSTEMAGSSRGAHFLNGTREVEADYYIQSTLDNARYVARASNQYHQMPELGRFGHGTGISLTLGLQHFEGGTIPFSGPMHQGFVQMRGDEFYAAAAGSTTIGTEAAGLEVISNPGNQHHRLGPGQQQLLHDFVEMAQI
ncbi:hypothetical protein SAY86_012038 [Trapa natans]|uniref:Homeobox domain-containing protein n=1 Tax=Trapa natans TaxID=22666 RepID=A0AAN7R6N3_TRANT|nr:hypothetical protein SAY86_012038 [Trapa natans]